MTPADLTEHRRRCEPASVPMLCEEIERLQDLVRDLRRQVRQLDRGNHAEQSWDDYCRDTERMISGDWRMEEK